MADDPKDQAVDPKAKPRSLTPSEIADLELVAAPAKARLTREIEHVDQERSGQLSPPHTPGRKR